MNGMLEYKAGDTLTIGDTMYEVRQEDEHGGCYDTSGRLCAFRKHNKCTGRLIDGGDCRPWFRKDRKGVVFQIVNSENK